MSDILVTIRLSQYVSDNLKSEKTLERQFRVKTQTDLAYGLDMVEDEARKTFEFEKTGVTATFNKDNVRTYLEEEDNV
jgi:hypothetical protein